jgi:hypothetical protein
VKAFAVEVDLHCIGGIKIETGNDWYEILQYLEGHEINSHINYKPYEKKFFKIDYIDDLIISVDGFYFYSGA